jgi:hypothetical protein
MRQTRMHLSSRKTRKLLKMVPLENFTVSTLLTHAVVTPVHVAKDARHHVVQHVTVTGIIVLLVVITQTVTFPPVLLVTHALLEDINYTLAKPVATHVQR